MSFKKCLSIVIASAALAAGSQTPAASAATCVTSNLPSSNVTCGAGKGKATLTNQNTRVLYSITSNTGDLVSGVPVRADGSTVIPEQADTGGGTCNVVRASTGLGLFTERSCHMVIASDAKRYFMQG
jgi:hypothetical protein